MNNNTGRNLVDSLVEMGWYLTKKRPLCAAVGVGIAAGTVVVLPRLVPTFERCWKYSTDKLVESFRLLVQSSALPGEQGDIIYSAENSDDSSET